ncbi:hypothetical protein JCM3766R1_005305 [Sporobolomyces carnicolor]
MVSDPIPPTPNLSPPPPLSAPSNEFLFNLALETPITRPPAPSDPRVSLRNGWPASLPPPERNDDTRTGEMMSLLQVREHEGRSKRLERLREVFESIPDPPTAPTSPKLDSQLALPALGPVERDQGAKETPEDERKRWELERKTYMRELWKKCGATTETTPATTTSAAAPRPSPSPSSSSSSQSPCLRWSSFETYADAQERLLYSIFSELDSDHNLKLTPLEVEHACRKAGVEGVDKSLIEGFVKALDKDGDGMIGWEEWRDFLILLPRKPSVKEIFHFYRCQTRSSRPSMSRLTQDGDVVIGRGKTSFNRFLANKTSSTKVDSSAGATSAFSALTNLSNVHRGEKERKRMLERCDLHKEEDENSGSAVECRWAREERERRLAAKRRKSTLSSAATKGLDFEGSGVVILDQRDPSPVKSDPSKSGSEVTPKEANVDKERKRILKTAEKEESSVTSTPSSSSTPIPPTRKIVTPPTTTPNGQSTSRENTIETTTTVREPEDGDDEEDDDEPGMFAGAGKFLLAGGMAGAVSRTATAPFDRLKVYLITSPSTVPLASKATTTSGSSKSKAATTKPPRRNAGSLAAAVRAVYSQGGVKAFWTGNMLNIIKIFPESAIKFLSYESAKRVFAQHWDCVPDQTMISNTSRFISGGIGGVVSQLSIYPIESLKTRVMSSTGGSKRGNALIIETFLDMYKKGGLAFFFRGLPAGLIGVFPYAAIDMSTFEGIKISYTKWAGEEPGIAGSLCFGAVSGGVGATSVYPLNLVRTRLQAQGTPAHPQVYTGIRDAAIKCFQREGWRGFYKGLTPTLVKVVPAVAISYAVYDQSKRLLFGKEDDHSHSSNDSSEEA